MGSGGKGVVGGVRRGGGVGQEATCHPADPGRGLGHPVEPGESVGGNGGEGGHHGDVASPVSDPQNLLKSTQAAPEAIIGVDQAAPVLAVLASPGCIPGKAAHEVGHAQAG